MIMKHSCLAGSDASRLTSLPPFQALSCSIDSTLRVWDWKRGLSLFEAPASGVAGLFACRWSPLHPAVFAACDAEGDVQLWNLCESLEVCSASARAPGGGGLSGLGWSSDGRCVAAGDVEGGLHVFGVKCEAADDEAWDQVHAALRGDEE